MSRQHVRGLLRGSAALCAMLALCSTAWAIPLTFNSGTGSQSFKTTLSAAGSLSVSANLPITISVGSGLTGFVVNGSLNIPTQTVAVQTQPNPTIIMTSPSGSANLTLAGQQAALGTDPGNDGLPPFGPGANVGPDGLPSVLTYADLTNLNATFVGNQAFSLNQVQASGNTSLSLGVLGNLNFGTVVRAQPVGHLKNVAYSQTAGTDFLSTPGINTPSGTQDQTATYGIAGAVGNISAGFDAGLSLNATLTLSVLGLFDIPFDFNFGTLNIIDTSASANFPLVGNALLRDLNPNGYDGLPTGDDLQLTISEGLLGNIPLNFNVGTNASVPVNYDTTIDLSILGTGKVHVAGSVSYSLNANLGATNTSYQLQTTVPDVVIPEPSSLLLACFGGLGLLVAVWRRRRA